MRLANDSITVVLVGDWNKFYMQPEWMSKSVYEVSEIEIGINGRGTDYEISYRAKDVTINPSQDSIVFTAMNSEDETIQYLNKCVNNFLEKSSTPVLSAYGFNIEYVGDETEIMATVIDSMSDNSLLIEKNYQISNTEISRTLEKNDVFLNMNCKTDMQTVTIHFNQHFNVKDNTTPQITQECINAFISETKEIIEGLGYEIGEED